MELINIRENIWISSFDEEKDRPTLGLIIGNKINLAIDAGHSKEHVQEFYDLLKRNNLPLPDLTILTHYHWDHSFGIHAINGISICEERTNKEIINLINNREYIDNLLKTDKYVALEYQNQEVIIKECDIVYKDNIDINLGNTIVRAFHTISSHSEDSQLIYLPKEKILFFGDSKSGKYPDWIIDKDKRSKYIETIKSIDFEIGIGSHWLPYKKEDLINELLDDLLI